jgi:hypothetical protein
VKTALSNSGDRLRRGNRYLLGMGAVFVLFLGLGGFAPADWRPSLAVALALSMIVQIPLGFWLLASVGTERFLPVWVLGMLVRLTVVGVAGLALFPAFRWPAGPGLLGLVLLLAASLALEGLVLLLEFRGAESR